MLTCTRLQRDHFEGRGRLKGGTGEEGQGNAIQGQGNAIQGQGNAIQGQGNAIQGEGRTKVNIQESQDSEEVAFLPLINALFPSHSPTLDSWGVWCPSKNVMQRPALACSLPYIFTANTAALHF
jgi:hypothetical protein